MKYTIYLDLCCFNRPYDDQTSRRVYLETEAKLFIQEQIKTGNYALKWSYILDFENSANPDDEVKDQILHWKGISSEHIMKTSQIIKLGHRLNSMGFGVKDSLHLSCAIEGHADFFLTTDKGILKKSNLLAEIRIMNPVDFIFLMEDGYEK